MPELLARRAGGVRARAESALLRRRLLPWYRRDHRKLPWRETRDPYRIWVSEVMLQQTQVATVTPFYQRFLDRFPNVASLARAREPEVLALWSGLGYYRRARHLLAAAREVVREHAGNVPDDPERFRRLPGVGPYTAAAVLSIAFGRPLPVLDGNVARVLSRLYALEASVRDPRGAKALWDLAAALVPARAPGEWNQALMELGATICLPRAPRCARCPVRSLCRARRSGRIEDFPPRVKPAPARKLRRAVALLERGGRLLMARRRGRHLDGLWEPPGVELESRSPARARLEAELERLGVATSLSPTGSRVRHRITRHEITVQLWRGSPRALPPRSSGLRMVDPHVPAVAITALARKLGAAVGRGRRSDAGARRRRRSRRSGGG